jgi:hypothetical protein
VVNLAAVAVLWIDKTGMEKVFGSTGGPFEPQARMKV